jgi:HK97 family phage major capsid protein
MNLEEMRKRLGEIQAKLTEFAALENYSEQDVQEIDELNTEFKGLKSTVEKIEVIASQKDRNGGFSNFGEFLGSVRKAASGHKDKRFDNTAFERSGEDGGFLIPSDFMSQIHKKIMGDDSLLARTTQFRVSGNSLSLPTDENAPWLGGIQAFWTDEGAVISDTKARFGKASWKLHKLAALVKLTDELAEDATALESYVVNQAPVSMTYVINKSIISGDGVGKPEGMLNSGYKVVVAKESGQLADTVVAANVLKMYSRLLPNSRSRAAWFINPAVESELRVMRDPAGNYIYLAPGSQMNQTPYGLLLGLPVIPLLGGMPALGDQGDIILADLSSYYTITKASGIKQDMSAHLYFDQAVNAYRFLFRVDGRCPYKSPVTTELGAYQMSAIITLADRA